jgi:hypothetical protein
MQVYAENCKHLEQHTDKALSALLSFLVAYLKPDSALVTRRRALRAVCVTLSVSLINIGLKKWVQHRRSQGLPVLLPRPAHCTVNSAK